MTTYGLFERMPAIISVFTQFGSDMAETSSAATSPREMDRTVLKSGVLRSGLLSSRPIDCNDTAFLKAPNQFLKRCRAAQNGRTDAASPPGLDGITVQIVQKCMVTWLHLLIFLSCCRHLTCHIIACTHGAPCLLNQLSDPSISGLCSGAWFSTTSVSC